MSLHIYIISCNLEWFKLSKKLQVISIYKLLLVVSWYFLVVWKTSVINKVHFFLISSIIQNTFFPGGCEDKICLFDSVCESQHGGTGRCVCPDYCIDVSNF